MLYFNSQAPGGSATGDLSLLNNFWQDSGNTVPAIALPSSTDDLILQDIALLGSASCNNLTDASGTGANYIGGTSSITCYDTATDVQINGGGLVNGASTINFVGCILNTNTVFSGLGSPTCNSSSSCQFNVLLNPDNVTLVDDGSAIWGGVNFQFASITAPAMTTSNAATFSSPVICPSINCPASSFDGTISQTGPTVSLNVGSLGGAVTWTDVVLTSLGSMNCVAGEFFISGGVANITLTGSGGTVQAALPTFTPAQYVLTGQTSGGNAGSLTLPATNKVLAPSAGGPASWGAGGTGSTGTLVPSGGVLQNGYSGGFNG